MKRYLFLLLLITGTAQAEYTFWLTNDKPWVDPNQTVTSSDVIVQSYVPGSNSYTTRTLTVYMPGTTTSNNLGDTAGHTYSIYGSHPYNAWALTL